MAEQNQAWLLKPLGLPPCAVAEREAVQYLTEFRPLPVPFTPAHCATAIVWQNQIVPIMNLAVLAKQAYSDTFSLAILAYQTEPGQPLHYIALAIAAAPEKITVTDDTACELPEEQSALWAILAKSCIQHSNSAVPIISVAKLDSVELRRYTQQAFAESEPRIQKSWANTAAVVKTSPLALELNTLEPAVSVPTANHVKSTSLLPALTIANQAEVSTNNSLIKTKLLTSNTFSPDNDDELLADDWDSLSELEDEEDDVEWLDDEGSDIDELTLDVDDDELLDDAFDELEEGHLDWLDDDDNIDEHTLDANDDDEIVDYELDDFDEDAIDAIYLDSDDNEIVDDAFDKLNEEKIDEIALKVNDDGDDNDDDLLDDTFDKLDDEILDDQFDEIDEGDTDLLDDEENIDEIAFNFNDDDDDLLDNTFDDLDEDDLDWIDDEYELQHVAAAN